MISLHPESTIRFPTRLILIFSVGYLLFSVFITRSIGQNSQVHIQVEDQDAVNLLRQAERRKEKGFMSRTAEIYLNLIKRHSGAVLQQERLRFVGVTRMVRRRISELSSEEMDVLRRVFQKDARSRYKHPKQVSDRKRLREIARIYFPVEYGRVAALKLARLSFKKAAFKTAIHWWSRLLSYQPDNIDHDRLRRRMRFTLKKIPDQTEFADLRADLGRAEQRRTVGKKARGRKKGSSLPADGAPDWRRPGGNNKGTGRVHSLLDTSLFSTGKSDGIGELIKLWSSSPRSLISGGQSGEERDKGTARSEPFLKQGSVDSTKAGAYSPIQPILYQGMVFVNDSSHLLAYGLADSLTKALHGRRRTLRWSYPEMQTDIDQEALDTFHERGSGVHSLAAHRGAVYAHMRNKLHKVNAINGQPLFVSDPPVIDGERLFFNGTPLITEHGVFVPLVRRIAGNRVELFVASYTHRKGKLDWVRFLGVIATNENPFDQSSSNRDHSRKFAHLLSVGNDLLFASNMGLVSSLDAVAGEMNWVYNYSGMKESNDLSTPSWQPSQTSARGTKPPRILNNHVYVLPWDSPYFLGFDVDTGEREFSHPLPNVIRFVDTGNFEMFNGRRAAVFVRENEQEVKLKLLTLSNENTEQKLVDLFLTHNPSVSPGHKRLILADRKKLNVLRRTNMYLKYSGGWPEDLERRLFSMIAAGPRIILAGPGGVTVFTTPEAILRDVSEKVMKGIRFMNAPLFSL